MVIFMSKRIVILTGAGVSAESGIRTFRASDGLWEDHRIEDVATPEGFRKDPQLVHRFYNERRRQLLGPDLAPNPAHEALARLERGLDDEVLIVTQNIDDLHTRAGSKNVLHMHGELLRSRCMACDEVVPTREDVDLKTACPVCGVTGMMRPHVVWFGEMPLYMEQIFEALSSCDVFAAIGTSGNVHPAAGFVQIAANAGAHTVELNLEPSLVNRDFQEFRSGPAGTEVPKWVDELLS